MANRSHSCSRCHDAKPVSGGYCRACANAWSRENRNGRWDGSGKYKKIRSNGKIIREHRVIVETYLGRALSKQEYVHHVDMNPLNNSIDNLLIVSALEHSIIHRM